jgi:hypothetical protein
MAWRIVARGWSKKVSGAVCRVAIAENGSVTIRLSPMLLAEAGLKIGDPIEVALGDGEHLGWMRLVQAPETGTTYRIGPNGGQRDAKPGPHTGKLQFMPPVADRVVPSQTSAVARWQISDGALLIVRDEVLVRSMERPTDRRADFWPNAHRRPDAPEHPYHGGEAAALAREEVVPVDGGRQEIVEQPPPPEPEAGADDEAPLQYTGVYAHLAYIPEPSPAEVEAGVDSDVKLLAELGHAAIVSGLDPDLMGIVKRPEKPNPPPPWSRPADVVPLAREEAPTVRVEGAYGKLTADETERFVQAAAAGADDGRLVKITHHFYNRKAIAGIKRILADRIERARQHLAEKKGTPKPPAAPVEREPVVETTPETWRELRQIAMAAKAAGCVMERVNVAEGPDRMKLNGDEMTPEECLEKVRVIVEEWEAVA